VNAAIFLGLAVLWALTDRQEAATGKRR
jgi:hypothetical protein